jgi:hypothetical protein
MFHTSRGDNSGLPSRKALYAKPVSSIRARELRDAANALRRHADALRVWYGSRKIVR